MVEGVIAIPLFIVVLIVCFDLLRVWYYNLSLEYALTRAARISAMRPGEGEAAVRAYINAELASLAVTFEPTDTLVVCPLADFNNNTNCNKTGAYHAGEARDMVVYQVSKPVTVYTLELLPILGRRQLILTTMTVVQNQPV